MSSDKEGAGPLEDSVLLVREVAQILGVTHRSVRNWVDEGILPCVRTPTYRSIIRIRAKDLIPFISNPPKRIAPGAMHRLVGNMRVSEVPKEQLFDYATEF